MKKIVLLVVALFLSISLGFAEENGHQNTLRLEDSYAYYYGIEAEKLTGRSFVLLAYFSDPFKHRHEEVAKMADRIDGDVAVVSIPEFTGSEETMRYFDAIRCRPSLIIDQEAKEALTVFATLHKGDRTCGLFESKSYGVVGFISELAQLSVNDCLSDRQFRVEIREWMEEATKASLIDLQQLSDFVRQSTGGTC